MKLQRVSLDHIAKLAGVHKATVSRALRNHPAIPLTTRERIKEIAKQQGYKPNPIVSMYQAQARSSRPARMQAAFAWISDYSDPAAWEIYPWLKGYLQGARRRSEERGYRLELVQAHSQGEGAADEAYELQRNLRGRGIFGVVLPLMLQSQLIDQEWAESAVAVIGNAHLSKPDGVEGLKTSFYPRGFEIAERDIYFNTRLALTRLRELGYERIGMIYSEYMDAEANGSARAAYLAEPPRAGRPSLPILLIERFKEGRPRIFEEWLEKEKPDVLLCVNPMVRDWLVELGLRVPEDIGLANLNLVSDTAGWAGITEHHEDIGAAAIDLLIGQLSRNEIGSPRHPRKILVPGSWQDGATLRLPRWQDQAGDPGRKSSKKPLEGPINEETQRL